MSYIIENPVNVKSFAGNISLFLEVGFRQMKDERKVICVLAQSNSDVNMITKKR